MFGSTRGGIPFAIPFFFVLGLVAFAFVGSATAAVGAALVFPFLLLKVFFLFFLLRMMFGFARGGSPWGGGRAGRGWGGRRWAPPTEPTEEDKERAEAKRAAKEEVDSLFPDL